MQTVYQNPNQPTTEAVYRTNIILWAAMLFSQFTFLILLFFIKREMFSFNSSESAGVAGGNPGNFYGLSPLVMILAVLGLIALALSFVIKARMLKFAIDNKSVELVQQGQIVAYALCEAVSLFGLVAAFAANSRFFFLFFAVGIVGMSTLR